MFLVIEMCIKGGAAHICPIDNLLHRQCLESLLPYQGHKSASKKLVGPLNATINFLCHPVLRRFRTRQALLAGNEHPASACYVPSRFDLRQNDREYMSTIEQLFIKGTKRKRFVPAAGRHWALPLYDPLVKLLGIDAIRTTLLDQAMIQPAQRVLDIGCGTGSLAILIKSRHPGTEVI